MLPAILDLIDRAGSVAPRSNLRLAARAQRNLGSTLNGEDGIANFDGDVLCTVAG